MKKQSVKNKLFSFNVIAKLSQIFIDKRSIKKISFSLRKPIKIGTSAFGPIGEDIELRNPREFEHKINHSPYEYQQF